MASDSECGLSSTRRSCTYYITNSKSDTEKGTSSPTPDPSSHPSTVKETNPITYPEGGRQAWSVVIGAWCGLTASIGIYNTTGVFEVIISQSILPDTSPSKLGWIFSIYAFVVWIFGVQVGPTFDVMGPTALIVAGSICTLVGMFALSFSTGKSGSLSIQYLGVAGGSSMRMMV